MKNYYALFTDQSGLNGVPIFLDARLWERIPEDPMAPVTKEYDYDWLKPIPRYEKVIMPDTLNLVVKAPKVNFDYYWFRSGFIVSEAMKNVIDQFNTSYVSSSLHVVSNQLKKNSEKLYYFIRFYSSFQAVDYDLSKFDAMLNPDGSYMTICDSLWIRKYEKIQFKQKDFSELFCVNDNILMSKLFCSETFKIMALQNKLYGLQFVPLTELTDHINENRFLKPHLG
ncbi:MAG: hypothetical protein JNM95_07000 [Chitinophagaceae bacterium]|nr:hypothetical protein [Chitinophagaceae bacterium]